jgi:hypothetical protein
MHLVCSRGGDAFSYPCTRIDSIINFPSRLLELSPRRETRMNVHDRKLRCQQAVPAKRRSHSTLSTCIIDCEQTQIHSVSRRFLSKHFFSHRANIAENYLRHRLHASSHSSSYILHEGGSIWICSLAVCRMCDMNIYQSARLSPPLHLVLLALFFANDSGDLIKKLFTSNHLNRKSSRDFLTLSRASSSFPFSLSQ